METGAPYSNAYDHPTDLANSIGQRYYGPVVLITDARCYSATDIFCAGFADHRIGPVLGVDANTERVVRMWTHGLLHQLVTTWRASIALPRPARRGRHAGGDPAHAAGRGRGGDAGRGPRRSAGRASPG